MRLTSQHLAEIVTHARGQTVAGAGSEQRLTTRMDLRCKVGITISQDKQPPRKLLVMTRDISLDGIGLIASVAVPRGQQLVVSLPRNATLVLPMVCEVMFCGPLADGIYLLGCRFVSVVKAEGAAQATSKRAQKPAEQSTSASAPPAATAAATTAG